MPKYGARNLLRGGNVGPGYHWFMLKTAATWEMPRSATAEETDLLRSERVVPARDPASDSHRCRCFHCGSPCATADYLAGEKAFCCQGCLTVFELLAENGLDEFYRVAAAPGVQGGGTSDDRRFEFVDQPAVRERLVDFSNDRLTRVTFQVPAIHCIACVWLLENLFRLRPGIGHSQVNFPRKEVAISFDAHQVRLSEVITTLAALGYEPDLRFSDLQGARPRRGSRRLWVQLGVAGFAFGNTMLFSIASYIGLDSATGPGFQKLVGSISLVLAIPVFLYSAADYWRAAWISLRQRLLNIDVPIAAGLIALFAQSTYEVLSGHGEGYFDSLCGLLFFLLCGRLFQQKTFDRLAFDRDYESFFPLAVKRITDAGEAPVALSLVVVGDRLMIRNGELIPADSRLVEGVATIDYSFVTGESEPVAKQAGDYLYAGGRQIGSAIQVETVKRVSQGYLTSLWNQEVFQKGNRRRSLQSLTNTYSQRFTRIVLLLALGAAGYWSLMSPNLALKSFTSVLIVACPCALALAAPFTLGMAQRVLGRQHVFLKNAAVVEAMAAADTIVFDKTGTLTHRLGPVAFRGAPLSGAESAAVRSLTQHSTHPYAVRIGQSLSAQAAMPVTGFCETPGFGMKGGVGGRQIEMGSTEWFAARGLQPSTGDEQIKEGEGRPGGSQVHLAVDGLYRGRFQLASTLRPATETLLGSLGHDYHLALLSGDNAKEQERFRALFPSSAELHFNKNPLEKLDFVRRLQLAGRRVVMVGDGLNDAGALKQSDVGIAVVENAGSFSPASDVIMAAGMVPRLGLIIRFTRQAVGIVRASFLISTLYNVVGIGIAARGLLEPVVCAVLMPLSSVSVVAFACGVTSWYGRRIFRRQDPAEIGAAATLEERYVP